tara:strand:- start:67 stop:402 length:336 start_codon:yes stop_codon:yes gene_type:complete
MNNYTYNNLKPRQRVFIDALVENGITRTKITRADMLGAMNQLGLQWPPAWIVKEQGRRNGRGYYDVPEIGEVTQIKTPPATDTTVVLNETTGTEHVVGDVDADAVAELQSV